MRCQFVFGKKKLRVGAQLRCPGQWAQCRRYQWRIFRVFKVFSEHVEMKKKFKNWF